MNNNGDKESLFHTLDAAAAFQHLETHTDGLPEDEVKRRQDLYGLNELKDAGKKTLLDKFAEQFRDAMVIILILAAVISGVSGEWIDSIIIIFVVMINAVLGVIQESKAEQALEALKKLSSPLVKVRRSGEIQQINSSDIVPGDIVILEAGDRVPADMRLFQSSSLKVEEAALTGESVPVEKTTNPLEEKDLFIGDRKNMAFSGSNVTYGRGAGIVTATGMQTEVGKIAGHLSRHQAEPTPLQHKIAELSKYLTIGVVIIAAVIFLAGIVQGRSMGEMFLTAISLAVAAVPEGLPAIITIVLALGVQRMAKRNAIIRKLSAVETLGGTEIICSDKTGTLTQNKMTVQEVYFDNRIAAADRGQDTALDFSMLCHAVVLCNDSKEAAGDNAEERMFIGDPTETALTDFGLKWGFSKSALDRELPRIGEIPFDSDRKLMTTVHQFEGRPIVFTKGAPDVLTKRCSRMYINGHVVELTDEHVQSIVGANKKMADKALRVLAAAYKEVDELPEELTSDSLENDLIFIGLVGMIDPPREEAMEAIRVCSKAGIRPIMITGDHKDTAAAIAKQLQMIEDDREVITGSELNAIGDQDFEKVVSNYSVYARVTPEHKIKIVETWQKQGKVIAMTGDGVNDAPALKAANIGVAMGKTGTDVAKGASDMVLSDDNFATIVVAVEEGRKIYRNILKAVQFLLSCNLGEITALFLGTIFNWIVLFPIHILWINLVTDTLPALALGVEKADENEMEKHPHAFTGSLFSNGVGWSILYQGFLQGALMLLSYYIGMKWYSDQVGTTMAFATLGLIQLVHAYNVRSNTGSVFKIGFLTNKYLSGAIGLSVALHLTILLTPALRDIFKVTALGFMQWLIVIGISVSIIPFVEIVKFVMNKRRQVRD